MANSGNNQSIKWFIIIVLILSVFGNLFGLSTDFFNYGVALALIYIILRIQPGYSK